ncbi:MAG: alanine:cation symporter family protein [Longibaculum sp.]
MFRLVTIAVIFFGAQADFSMIWDLADVLMGFMALIILLLFYIYIVMHSVL